MKPSYYHQLDERLWAWVHVWPDEVVPNIVSHIYTPPDRRGEGVARQLMAQMLSDADREGVTLCLSIEPDPGGLTRRQLAAWYARLGFQRRNTNYYVRTPRTDERTT